VTVKWQRSLAKQVLGTLVTLLAALSVNVSVALADQFVENGTQDASASGVFQTYHCDLDTGCVPIDYSWNASTALYWDLYYNASYNASWMAWVVDGPSLCFHDGKQINSEFGVDAEAGAHDVG
jgi:hypothetical protein